MLDKLKKAWLFIEQVKRHAMIALFIFIIFFGFFAFLALTSMAANTKSTITIEPNSALLLELNQPITEQGLFPNNILDIILQVQDKDSISNMEDILKAIDLAKKEKNIKGIVLKTGDMFYCSTSKIEVISKALREFKAAGKKVYAVNGYYTQGQYLLATNADKVFLNPIGGIQINGFSVYRTYLKEAIEKLNITMNIFRVGTFKSALEPFFRTTMSEEAKTANKTFLDVIWKHYKDIAQKNRPLITTETIENYTSNFVNQVLSNQGDLSKLALETKLVDELADQATIDKFLEKEFGSDKKSIYKQTTPKKLLKLNKQKNLFILNPKNKIGVVVVQGSILNGEHPNDNAGGISVSNLIRQATNDLSIKALILRVDSGGGSVYASEQIRSELLNFKNTGRPLFASFGSMAASGGYWISTPADEIWSEPTTITGSIGIFGAIPTFEKIAQNYGVNVDGVSSTNAPKLSLIQPIPEHTKNMIQSTIEFGYAKFLNLVSESRGLSIEEVDKIAQGRVWSGEHALELKLVDQLGSLADVVSAAALKANLTDYDVHYITKNLNEQESVFAELIDSFDAGAETSLELQKKLNPLLSYEKILKELNIKKEWLYLFNDPNHAYSYSFIDKAP